MSTSGGSENRISGNAPDLVLASTSPYRQSTSLVGRIPFRSRPPLCDESTQKAGESNPVRLAESLAQLKAKSLLEQEAGATIIGCDQVLSFDGQIFGKPSTVERAVEQLTALSGRTHDLITALVVIRGAQIFNQTDVTRLQMRPLSGPEIERYVKLDQPLDCAGSYKIESRGIALFEKIESADQTAITGMPLIALVRILRDLGYEIP